MDISCTTGEILTDKPPRGRSLKGELCLPVVDTAPTKQWERMIPPPWEMKIMVEMRLNNAGATLARASP